MTFHQNIADMPRPKKMSSRFVGCICVIAVSLMSMYHYKHISERNIVLIQAYKSTLLEQQGMDVSGVKSNSKISYNNGPMSKRLPEAFIIGEIKCGYKTLSTLLNSHPQVVLAKKQHDYFFANYSKGLEWYRDKMPLSRQGQMVIDTNTYFGNNFTTVCNRIKSYKEDIKLIVMLCDPVRRLVSHFRMMSRFDRSLATHGIEDYVLKHEDGEIKKTSDFVQRGLYDVHMKNWLKCFPLQQIHIVDGENFMKNHLQELRAIETYLNLERYFSNTNVFYNKMKGLFCYIVTRKMKCLPYLPSNIFKFLSVKTKEKLIKFYQPNYQKFMSLVRRKFQW